MTIQVWKSLKMRNENKLKIILDDHEIFNIIVKKKKRMTHLTGAVHWNPLSKWLLLNAAVVEP